MKEFFTHPLLTAIIGGLTGSVFTWLTIQNSPPVVSLVPDSITVDAAESVTFDGQGSKDTDGTIKKFEWSVGGNKYDETNIASCSGHDIDSQITCRFVIPGSHVVSLAAIDNDDARTVQSGNVRVKMPGGYIGVVLQYGVKVKDKNLQNAFNYGVDWIKVQALLRGKPVILFDPNKQEPVFATQFARSVKKATEYANKSDNTRGLRVLARLPPEAKDKLTMDLAEIGVDVTFVGIAFGEVFQALEKGLADSSFAILDEPDALSKYYE